MPRVPSEMLEAAVFLYESVQDARTDANFCATGSIVAIPAKTVVGAFHYVVTNAHVINNLTAVAIRLNDTKGGTICIDTKVSDWRVSGTHDLAAILLSLSPEWECKAINISDFATRARCEKHKIGPGDELFLVSRYQREDVKYQRNHPLMRFGNISMNPTEKEDYFTVELRSIGGHSGSPVFVYDLPFTWSTTRTKDEKFMWMFLGIDAGHIIDYGELVKYDAISKKTVKNSTWLSVSNVALAEVVPAFLVEDFLRDAFSETMDGIEAKSADSHPPDRVDD